MATFERASRRLPVPKRLHLAHSLHIPSACGADLEGNPVWALLVQCPWGIAAVGMIFAALIFRAAGVCICMLGTELNLKERLFCVIAYLPKATVQAAIGSVPLSFGLPCGKIVLSVAVLAIIITAPLGALGIDISCKRFLESSEQMSGANN